MRPEINIELKTEYYLQLFTQLLGSFVAECQEPLSFQ